MKIFFERLIKKKSGWLQFRLPSESDGRNIILKHHKGTLCYSASMTKEHLLDFKSFIETALKELENNEVQWTNENEQSDKS